MSDEKTEERKKYTKPEIRRVTLKPEESLAAGCKTLSTSASGFSPCNAGSCMNIGS